MGLLELSEKINYFCEGISSSGAKCYLYDEKKISFFKRTRDLRMDVKTKNTKADDYIMLHFSTEDPIYVDYYYDCIYQVKETQKLKNAMARYKDVWNTEVFLEGHYIVFSIYISGGDTAGKWKVFGDFTEEVLTENSYSNAIFNAIEFL